MYFIRKIFRQDIFQGAYKHKNYFEGWYYKLISHDQKHNYAVIPGLAMGQNSKDDHAFVQIINGNNGQVEYFRYPLSSFKYSKRKFAVQIADNSFSHDFMRLRLKNPDLQIDGELYFNDIVPFPRSIFNPGIMGPFTFVPFMECYHGIININHSMEGSLRISDRDFDFSGGEGYLEKDYGKSFPSEWIWLQANHFNSKRTCFMFSIASIPWFKTSFIGLICFLLHEGKLYRFATYNRSRIEKISLQNKTLEVQLSRQDQTLTFKATGSLGGFLKAPKNGLMERSIEESITANVEVMLSNRKGIIFSGTSTNAGYELSSGAEKLLATI